ncbi:hypothetical protein ACGFRB_10805 [Streptomyces sp. NPDC048718]|uniref:hypothetical protein n=1 Tax=Streptomyces sp. NPDC048718 TaxID=3365587 RepID=UPI00371EEF6E
MDTASGSAADAAGEKRGRAWYRRVRRADSAVAVLVGMGNLLLCWWLLLMDIGSGITFGAPDAVTQAETDATHALMARMYVGWLVGGLLVFALLRMGRSVASHLFFLVVPPAALFIYVAANP